MVRLPDHRLLRRFSIVTAVIGAVIASFIAAMSWLYWSPGDAEDLVANLVLVTLFVAWAAVFSPRLPEDSDAGETGRT